MSKTKKIILITIFVVVMLGIAFLIEWWMFERNRLKKWNDVSSPVEVEIKLENSKEKSIKISFHNIQECRKDDAGYTPISFTEVDPDLDITPEFIVKLDWITLQKGKPPKETDHDSIIRWTRERVKHGPVVGEPIEYYTLYYKLYDDKKADSISYKKIFEVRLYLKEEK